jgi:hypothetical protein
MILGITLTRWTTVVFDLNKSPLRFGGSFEDFVIFWMIVGGNSFKYEIGV